MKKKLLVINKAQFGYHIDTYYYCKVLSQTYDVTYVCFDEKLEKVIEEGVNVIYCDFEGRYCTRAFNFFKQIFSVYKSIKPNVVFVKYFLGSLALLFAIKRSKTILDIRTASVSKSSKSRFMADVLLKVESIFFRYITVISEGVRNRLKLTKSAEILPLGAIKISNKDKSYNNVKLLYVGTLDNRDIPITVDAVAKFVKEVDSNISYQIVGFGSESEEQKLKETIINNDLSDIVSFKGRVDVDSLAPYFDSNNVGIAYVPITEYYMHQPPTKVFEYSMSGLVTIATRTKINETLITDENGVLCEDNVDSVFNALIGVYNTLSNYEHEKVATSLNQFQWENIVTEILVPILNKVENAN